MFSRYSVVTQRAYSAAATKINVGFIGLGCMGRHMTKNLKKNGFHVKGYDINPESEKFCNEAGL